MVSVLTHQDVLERNVVEWDWRAVTRLCLQVATRVLGPGSTAEDAAQEAAMVAWRHRTDCQSPEAPWPWIAMIARREALRQRVAPTQVELDDEALAASPEEHQALLLRLDVRSAIAGLSEHDRALVLARYWNDLTQEQVAAVLQIPAGTVKVRLHRLREHLRPILEEP